MHFIANVIALWLAAHYITGFIFTGSINDLLIASLIFTLINTFIKPIVKLILGPFVVLTFGLLTIIINAAMLYLLDLWSPALTIQGYVPLLWSTLLVALVNLIVGLGVKTLEKE